MSLLRFHIGIENWALRAGAADGPPLHVPADVMRTATAFTAKNAKNAKDATDGG